MARISDIDGELVAVKACFPDTIATSVRQKSRWIIGIALAGWDRVTWRGGLTQKWALLRDRRAPFSAIVLFAAYLAIALTAINLAASYAGILDLNALQPVTLLLMQINMLLLGWRLTVRAGFTTAQYGMAEGLLSIPRNVVANIISIMAARRACFAYARFAWANGALRWDKTQHRHFPE
jgi:adsorption protein B